MEKTFKQVVKGIRRAEKNVDKVLDAARLQRIESGRMSDERFNKIMDLVGSVLLGIGMLIFFGMYILLLSGGFH